MKKALISRIVQRISVANLVILVRKNSFDVRMMGDDFFFYKKLNQSDFFQSK